MHSGQCLPNPPETANSEYMNSILITAKLTDEIYTKNLTFISHLKTTL